MKVHLVDGTFELFRAFFGAPRVRDERGTEIGAARGLLRTLVALLQERDVTHVGVAFDHVIESFRNDLYRGYKTGLGVDPDLMGQFGLAEDVAGALGVAVWSMVEFEADDALAAAAARYRDHVEQVVICTPDKDMAQCVVGSRVILLDRMRRKSYDEAGVVEKYGVSPASIPDWLALVGDSADGYPGIPRWGAKSAATVLRRYGRIEDIPPFERDWDITVRGAKTLGANLREQLHDALLFKRLATLRTDAPIPESLDDLRWTGPDGARLQAVADRIGERDVLRRLGA